MLRLVHLGDASGHPCLEKKQQPQEREAKLEMQHERTWHIA